jgi:hypothetical protein
MKNILLITCFLAAGLLAHAQNGLERVIVERYYVSDATDAVNSHPSLPAGSVTYRIYADMLPGYKVQSIYGSTQHPLLMNTTTSFFNQSDFGTSVPTISATNSKKNTVMLDSWLSTGGACNGYLGIPKADDNGIGTFVNSNVPQLLQNNALQAGIPLTAQDGMIAGTVPSTITLGLDGIIDVFGDGTTNGNSFLVTNGAWSCLSGAAGPIPASNKVLIAQITTDGIFHFELNIQIGTPSLGTERYVSSSPASDELTIPSLTQTLLPVPLPPLVNITSPANNSTFGIGAPISVTADASAPDGTVTIAQVEFFVDGISVGIDASFPYEATYTGLSVASHVLTAKATNSDGQFTTSVPVSINVAETNKILNLVVFLEGLYTGAGTQNKAQGSSGEQFPGDVADQVSLELHDAVTGSVVYSLSNVNLSTSGTLTAQVPAVHSGSYYIYIRHRNSLTTSSASPVSFTGNIINYDFSSGSGQAYGSNLKNIGGVAVLFGGDENQDGNVESTDMIDCDNDGAVFASGYMNTDINGDGVVDSSDMIIIDNNNSIFAGAVLPF